MDALTLERHIKKSSLIGNVISLGTALIVALGVCYGFYYSTTAKLNMHTSDIIEIKNDVSSIKNDIANIAVFKGMSEVERINLQDRVSRIENKQDKILDVLNTIQVNTSK